MTQIILLQYSDERDCFKQYKKYVNLPLVFVAGIGIYCQMFLHTDMGTATF